jgi:hypothetical protein
VSFVARKQAGVTSRIDVPSVSKNGRAMPGMVTNNSVTTPAQEHETIHERGEPTYHPHEHCDVCGHSLSH